MARTVGRDQLGPMERLIRILICLVDAGPTGAPIKRLLRMADLHEDTEATRAQLRRDLSILRHGGWEIHNAAAEGSDARYVLRVRDNRLAVLLTPGERAALREALAAAQADRSAPPRFFGQLHHAVEDRCLTSFTYRGRHRTVHPDALYGTASGWVLNAREEPHRQAKEFVAAWISDLEVGDPGTALEPPSGDQAERADPMTWPLDGPFTVTLGVLPSFVEDVIFQLPGAQVVGAHPGETLVEVEVTNQAAFRARLYSLALRVRVLAPPEAVDSVLDNLHAVVGGDHGDLR